MRLLHTADWHLGVKLHKKDLSDDHKLFFQWLIGLIQEREIDVLLISGDVFDYANPSVEARQLYFSFLKELINLKCRVIITGGNHDSPAVLNGPQEILKMLNIHVIGNLPADLNEQIICLQNKDNEVEGIICAVPYLRDSDIRSVIEGELFAERWQQRKAGIVNHFNQLTSACKEKFSEAPIILMAHLFAAGVRTSDHEREITIGGLDTFAATDFPDSCTYIALGHIHRPQLVGNLQHIRYSGSPIPLSFSEKMDQKIVIEIELNNKRIEKIQPHHIQPFRRLIKITGALKEVEKKLAAFSNNLPLKAFAELEIIEPDNDVQLSLKVHELISRFDSNEIEILVSKYKTTDTIGLEHLVDQNTGIEELNPMEILKKKLEFENVSEEQQSLIKEAFTELLQSIENEL